MNKLKKMMQLAKANKKGGSGQSTNLTSEANNIIEVGSGEVDQQVNLIGENKLQTGLDDNTELQNNSSQELNNSKLFTYKMLFGLQVAQHTEIVEVTIQADNEDVAFTSAKAFLTQEAEKKYPGKEVGIEYQNKFSIQINQELQNESK